MDEALRQQIIELIGQHALEDALDRMLHWAFQEADAERESQFQELRLRYLELEEQKNYHDLSLRSAMRGQAEIGRQLLDALPAGEEGTPPRPAEEEPGQTPVVLFLASNPSQTAKLQLDKEFVQIAMSLQDSVQPFELKAEWAVQPQSLMEYILQHRPRVLHFSGHGQGREGNAGNGRGIDTEGMADGQEIGIFLQDANGRARLVSGQALGSLFQTITRQVPVQLVLLNACYSAEQARHIGEHVPFVIGMSKAVPDKTAITFAKGFYVGLAYSRTRTDIDFAFQAGLTQIELMGLSGVEQPVLWVDGEKG
jgi:hypothetical protein